ncbi:MAG: N-acetylmuramidase domain-containing protein, partial [Gallionellaceae bacterium]|nr:N-acetylmuramidase domain-containing protein [Gallionellaceae bacterium]
GHDTVVSFVLAMTKSETEHLKAFTVFINNDPALLKALREKRWSDFASGYNGPGYKNNAYDTKLEAAYKRFAQTAASTGASGKTTPSATAGGNASPATSAGKLP